MPAAWKSMRSSAIYCGGCLRASWRSIHRRVPDGGPRASRRLVANGQARSPRGLKNWKRLRFRLFFGTEAARFRPMSENILDVIFRLIGRGPTPVAILEHPTGRIRHIERVHMIV